MPELNEINNALADFEEELSKLKTAADEIKKAENTAQRVIEQSEKLNRYSTKLIKAVIILTQKLNKVDFPTRLDKLDNSVTAINTAIQNIFGRFDFVEKNLKDEFNSKITAMQVKLEKSQKLNLIFLILIMLFAGSSLLTILVKFVF